MQKIIKDNFANDTLVIKSQKLARIKIENATRSDGTLDWKKLPKLVTVNPKLDKVDDVDPYLTAGFQGAPSWASGYNTCSGATLGCSKLCLFGAGHGQAHMIQEGVHTVWVARIVRTILFYEHRAAFEKQMIKELGAFARKAARKGLKTAFRPNVMTDIDFVNLMPSMFRYNATFKIDRIYDYTKVSKRVRTTMRPRAYHLTVSRTETTSDAELHTAMRWANVAVVFSTKKNEELPATYLGYPVYNGDLTDNRFNDPRGHIVGLREKKTGKVDTSGFVVRV